MLGKGVKFTSMNIKMKGDLIPVYKSCDRWESVGEFCEDCVMGQLELATHCLY